MTPFALVSGDFVPTGGMDRANYALADYLARRGHPVHLVAHRAAGELTRHPSVTLHRVPKLLGSYFLSEPLLNRAGMAWGRHVAAQGGRVLVNGGNCRFPDVNWVHYVHAAHRPVMRSGLVRRVKNVLAHRAGLASERKALHRARLVLANSEHTRRDVLEHIGLPEDRVRTVYYGIDPEQFRPVPSEERAATRREMGWPAERPLAVFIGALGDRRKGFDTLFGAWQQLCRAGDWDADLIVIGSGAELPLWQRRAGEAKLEDRVRFLGFRRDVSRLLPACDVLVAPTRYEAYGLGVHEAICCGLSAVVTRTAGVAERYPPELADLLVDDPDDAPALAALLRRWREREAAYRKETAILGARWRSYTWDQMAEQIVRLMELTTGEPAATQA